MAVLTLLKRDAGKGHLKSVDEANDQFAISGLVRTAAGAASVYTDANTTSITIGSSGTPTIVVDVLRGPDDGTGLVIGHAPSGATTGSAPQVVSVTTAQKAQLVAADGMVVVDSDLTEIQARIGGAWVNIAAGASAASETLSGIAELATQAETDAGTDDLRIVTPLKLASSSWIVSQQRRETPGEHLPLGLGIYNKQNNFNTASEIQYVRVWLDAGITIGSMRTFVDAGGLTGRNVRMGLYDQAIPLSEAGVPNSKVAETASTTTNAVTGYMSPALTSAYPVTTTGYYWIAFITDSTAVDWATTRDYPADFIPMRRETGTGVTLPTTAASLTNPASAVAYCSAVDQ